MDEDDHSSSIWGIDGVPSFFLVKNSEKDEETLENCEKLIHESLGRKTVVSWLTTTECVELDPESIAKTHVFVFPEFTGPAFEKLQTTKTALLLGPSALTRCLQHKEPIPTAPPPWIFNTAMAGLIITFSGFKESDKRRYSELISYMGGLCVPVLAEAGTHLVCNTVFSNKYEAAMLKGIPVMQEKWIEEVWKRNAKDFVSATDESFNVFQLPVFYNLNVAVTLLTNDERNLVEKLVSENGGIFHRTFKPKVVNILVVNENGKNSDKFKSAVRNKKVCLLPQWIIDSVKEGFALPFGKYEVTSEVRVSTPNKEAVQNPEFSVSHIQGSGNTTVNESVVSTRSNKNLSVVSEFPEINLGSPKPKKPSDSGNLPNDYYKESLKQLNLTKAKQAGSFLDGVNIFFSGFSPAEMGKLNKIISLSGATRYEELNENVTHVIVGKREDKELKAFQDMNKGLYFLKFDWLKECLEVGHMVSEDDHCYELVSVANKIVLLEQPSPASKRNIAAMNSSFKKPFPKNDQMAELSKKPVATSTPMDAAEEEEEYAIPRSNLMNRYLSSTAGNMELVERNVPGTTAAPEKGKENAHKDRDRRTTKGDNSHLMQTTFCTELDTDEYEHLNFFNGKKFAIQDVDSETEYTQLLSDIQNFYGVIVEKGHKGQIDFIVTSPGRKVDFKPQYKAKQVVTTWWVEDVIAARTEIPVEYYHQIITAVDETILQGITCTISTYGGAERMFLTQVAQVLGGTVVEKYEKRKTPVLICEKAEGMKYKGALTWGFPVVTKEWLLDTYHKSFLYKLEDYLVGESGLSNPFFAEINERGIARGSEPPQPSNVHNDSSCIQIRSESPFSQVPPSPMVNSKMANLKRKSDDGDTFVSSIEKRLKTNDNLVLLPQNSPATLGNNRVKALRTESKSSSSPTTPISQHIREMGVEFGYDTPRRKQLYDVLKETNNLTPASPHTPAVMKMPPTQLHPDPEATPGRQWDVLHKFSGFLSNEEKKKKVEAKKANPATPLSEIKRRFWQQTLGEEYVYNNNSTMMNINSQQLVVDKKNDHEDTTINPEDLQDQVDAEEEASTSKAGGEADSSAALQGLRDFISKRKSEPKKQIMNMETCPLEGPTGGPETKDTEIMVVWAEPSEVVPFKTPPHTKGRSVQRRNFITSGCEVDDELVRCIEELGGELQKDSKYDSCFTHVLCQKLGRVEKVLCAMAAGKWIISVQYVEDSYRAKMFLDEELYEWGNPKCKLSKTNLSSIENTLATAAYEWRQRIHDKASEKYRTGAFHGFRVLLWTKTAGFKKIISAGGGVCLEVGQSYRESAEVAKTATHCFIERRLPFPIDNFKFCQENKIMSKDIQFLNEYLLSDSPDTLKTFDYNPRTSGGGTKSGN